MPVARAGHGAVELNGKIYLVGGHSGTAYVTAVDVYDPASDTWSTGKSLANGRYGLGLAVVGGKILAAGGSNAGGNLSSSELYDPATDTWTAGSAMAYPRYSFSLVAANGKLYAVGGATNGSLLVAPVEAYDPATQRWSQLAAIPTQRAYVGAALVGGRIYALGGFTGCSGCSLGSNEAYDPATNAWTTQTALAKARLGVAATGSGDGRVMAIGGDRYSAVLADVDYYDPASNAWTAGTALPAPRREAAAVTTANGQVFVFGGTDASYKNTTTVYAAGSSASGQAFDVSAAASGDGASLSLSLDLKVAASDIGRQGKIYLGALLPHAATGGNWYLNNGSSWLAWTGGSAPAYFAGLLPASQSIPIMQNGDATGLGGVELWAGYGTDLDDMVGHGHVKQAYVFANTTPTSAATIGASGGSVAAGGASLTIPAGALSASAAIEIAGAVATATAGAVTAAYAITGLPAAWTKDIQVALPATGDTALAANEGLYLLVSTAGTAKSAKGSVTARYLVAASLANGQLVAAIPASVAAATRASGGESQRNNPDMNLQGVKRGAWTNDHFVAYGLSADKAAILAGLDNLDAAYRLLRDTYGFQWTTGNCRIDPNTFEVRRIPVYFDDLGADGAYGYQVSGKFGADPCGTALLFTDYIQANVNSALVDPADADKMKTMKATLGHELFHFLQGIYWNGVAGATAHYWLDEATAVWFELPFADNCAGAFMTDGFAFASRGLFNPLDTAVLDDSQQVPSSAWDKNKWHGYGASAAVAYATLAQGFKVRTLYEELRGGKTAVAAFQAALGATSLADFWLAYAGAVYSGTSRSLNACLPGPTSVDRTYVVGDATALPIAYTVDVYPMSASARQLKIVQQSQAIDVQIEAAGLSAGQILAVHDLGRQVTLAALTGTSAKASFSLLDAGLITLALIDTNTPASSAATQKTNTVTVNLSKSGAGTVPQTCRFKAGDRLTDRVDIAWTDCWGGSFYRNEYPTFIAKDGDCNTISAASVAESENSASTAAPASCSNIKVTREYVLSLTRTYDAATFWSVAANGTATYTCNGAPACTTKIAVKSCSVSNSCVAK